MKKKKDTFMSGPVMVIVMLVLMLLGFIPLYMLYFVEGEGKTAAVYIVCNIMFGIFQPGLFIYAVTKFGVKIELSERGIRRSLFKVFMVREIGWNELYEISIKFASGAWVFFSKSDLKKTPYSKAMRRKDQIQVAYSEKLRQAVKKYTDKEIPKVL
jgi:hypothetical protein